MMSLDYVSSGEPVRSSTINSLIDAVGGGGNQSPDLIFTGTPNGPQVVSPTQMGNSDIQKQCLFDVRNYTLEGWPMTQIQLGFQLSDALDAVKVRDEDGVLSAVSALMIIKNSANCPFSGGTLSGYRLEANDFVSQGYNNTGWVKTKMEGVFGKTTPKLQVWKSKKNHVYEVFSNAGKDETKLQLSTLLSQYGVEDEELSTVYMLGDWKLLHQTETPSGGRNMPTSRTQMMHGSVDVYDI